MPARPCRAYTLTSPARGPAHAAATAKELLRDAVERLPEDPTIEDAMERLYFLAMVARGLEAADRGDTVPHDEARREFLPEE